MARVPILVTAGMLLSLSNLVQAQLPQPFEAAVIRPTAPGGPTWLDSDRYDIEAKTGLPETALREQLGLRLESQKSPLEVLVIDSIDKPSEN